MNISELAALRDGEEKMETIAIEQSDDEDIMDILRRLSDRLDSIEEEIKTLRYKVELCNVIYR